MVLSKYLPVAQRRRQLELHPRLLPEAPVLEAPVPKVPVQALAPRLQFPVLRLDFPKGTLTKGATSTTPMAVYCLTRIQIARLLP